MGKHDGFIGVDRKVWEKQSVDDRLKHFQEIYKYLPENELINQASRCMNCCTPFCHGYGCPLGNIIPEWTDLVYNGHWREAAERLHLTNNFPEVTGRVCPALCEASCVLAISGEAVTIRQIELAVIEKAWEEDWIQPMRPMERTGKTIAVVGSGPSGLAAAQQLCRVGHKVLVFEKLEKPGGILRFGIPDFKLEKWILDRRIEQLKEEGVEFQCDIEAGNDFSTGYLRKKFDSVCLCGGASVPRNLNLPGRSTEGIHFAMDYLIQQNRRLAGLNMSNEDEILAAGKHVIIIGGGDTSNDCMGVALRQGAAHVEQFEILPQPPALPDRERTPWPLWPHMLRSSTSHEEGGLCKWNVNTREFLIKDDHVTGLLCEQVQWKHDEAKGRMIFEPVPESEFEAKADLVIIAMGFLHPQHEGLLDDLGVAYDPEGNVKVNEKMMTSVQGVFAAGDMMTGAWLVVGAIASGRRMARQVDMYLMGESDLPDSEPPPQLYL